MTIPRPPARRRFLSDDSGAILVEFGLVMSLMILFFSVTVEAARMMWSYQTAIGGVRDAARYMARTTPYDICDTAGSVAGKAAKLKDIVEKDIHGTGLFRPKMTINSVTPSYSCIAGTYRHDPVAIGVVTASLTMEFPLSGIMTLFGGALPTVTTTITDRARIFGQ